MELPVELVDACAPNQCATPETLFRIASKFYEPVVVGIATAPPHAGGPVLGFVLEQTVLSAFLVVHYAADGQQRSEYLTFDDLAKFRFTCMSNLVQEGLNLNTSRPWSAHMPNDRFPPLLVFRTSRPT